MPSFWLDRHLTPAPSSTPQGIDGAIFALASCCCNPPIELVHHLRCRRALMLKPRRPAWMRALDLGSRAISVFHPTTIMQPVRTSAATEVLAGLVERVTFHNAENGFSSCLRG
jgi:hypothetical protein